MAEIVLGDIVARLRLDASQLNQSMQEAAQRLQQLQQAQGQARQQQASTQQTTTQLAAAYLQLSRSIAEQTAAYAATNREALAFRQAQAPLQQQARQHAQALREQAQALRENIFAYRQQRDAMRDAQRGSGGLSGVLTVAGGVGLATSLGALIGQLRTLATETVNVGVRFEALQASLSAIAGSVAAGQQQFNMLYRTAQDLGVAFEPLARGWRTLTAAASQANLPMADQERLLKAVANEGRRLGASNEELGRALTALAQVAGKGKVSMEELRQQLGEALVTSMSAAARGMGMTTEELTKLVETGNVRFVPFARALTRGFEDIQASAGQVGDTAAQAFNRLANSFQALQRTLAQSGLNQYLVQVAKNLQEVVEWSTRLVRGSGGGAVGPTMGDLGATANQQRELERLQGFIARQEAQLQSTQMTPLMRETREAQLAAAREQRDQLLEVIRLTQDQAVAQGKVTAEANKTTAAQERQADFVENLRKSIEAATKAQADFVAKAAQAPHLLGDPRGTIEQQRTFARERQQALTKPLEDLAGLIAQRPAGTAVPPELLAQVRALDTEHHRLGQTLDELRDKEQARQKAARDAAQAARDAARDEEEATRRIIDLQATLARVQRFIRRPEQSPAEEAREATMQQGAAMRATIEQNIREFAESPALTRRAPEQLDALRQSLEALDAAMHAQGQQAYDRVIERQFVEPLRALERQYGMTKEASDAFTAHQMVMQTIGSPWEEWAHDVRLLVEGVGQLEARLPHLREQAAQSGRAFTQSQRFTEGLEQRLDQLRTPREFDLPGDTEFRAREQAKRQGIELQRHQEELLENITAYERLGVVMDLTGRIGESAASALTDGLLGIVDGTQKVGEAFKQMAKSILDSVGQLLLSEGFRLLLNIGLRALTGALTGGIGAATTPAYQLNLPLTPTPYQHGGYINRPTLALMGETGPEWIVPSAQMQALMQAGPSAGGQAAGGVSVILVDNRGQAEAAAMRERSLGKTVVIREVLDDLSQGEGSSIGRAMRVLQR